MARKQAVSFTLNAKPVEVVVEPRELLIHTLRETLLHTGPHIGCETSHCGACTVDLNGMSVKSCTVLTVQCQDADVLTIEGFGRDGALHALQVRLEVAREGGALTRVVAELRAGEVLAGIERRDLFGQIGRARQEHVAACAAPRERSQHRHVERRTAADGT